MSFFAFNQNNSGGRFIIDDEGGLGPRVWIEADDLDHACYRAKRIGIYFDGVRDDRDCSCCGDRWHEPWDGDGKLEVKVDPEYDFMWHTTVYVHHLDGSIERLKNKVS